MRAGDEIVKVAAGPERMTVAEVDALLYLPGHPRDRIERALRIPALSPGWQGSFRAHPRRAGSPRAATRAWSPVSPPPAWPGSARCAVTAVEPESTHDRVGAAGRPGRRPPLPRGPARAVPDRAAAPDRAGRRWCAATRCPGRPAPPTTGSASSASRTARAAGTCTPASAPATCSRWPRRAARSSCSPERPRSC